MERKLQLWRENKKERRRKTKNLICLKDYLFKHQLWWKGQRKWEKKSIAIVETRDRLGCLTSITAISVFSSANRLNAIAVKTWHFKKKKKQIRQDYIQKQTKNENILGNTEVKSRSGNCWDNSRGRKHHGVNFHKRAIHLVREFLLCK